MNKLNFRLTTPKHGSLTASNDDPGMNEVMFETVLELVALAFAKMGHPDVKTEGRTPEILSGATLAQIDALESALEFCRNLMIDSDAEDDDMVDDWKRAIDQAADALGYPEDER